MVTRYQVGQPEHLTIAAALEQGTIGQAPTPQAAPSTYVHSGVTRYTTGQDNTSSTGITTHSQSTGGTSGGSVAATLNGTFSRPSVELIPGDPSSRTLVQVAIREGLIRRGAGGQLEDINPVASVSVPAVASVSAPTGTPDQGTEQAPEQDPNAHVFDVQADQQWQADIESVPQFAYDAAISSSIALLIGTGRGTAEQTALDFADRAGIEPDVAAEYIDAGYTYYSTQVGKAVAPLGITGPQLDQFRAYIGTQPGKYQDAIQQLVHLRNPSGFVALAKQFKAKSA
jgi:hypothetical protein